MKKGIKTAYLLVLPIFLLSACEKFLDEKSDKRLSIPTTVEDFQAMLLTIAECNARLGNLADATKTLNQLLIKRYKSDYFIPFVLTNNETALQAILEERRKELVMRGLRWPDLKRLNRDGANITLSRTVNGQTHTLPPNDLRYAIAISEHVVEISGIKQNPR